MFIPEYTHQGFRHPSYVFALGFHPAYINMMMLWSSPALQPHAFKCVEVGSLQLYGPSWFCLQHQQWSRLCPVCRLLVWKPKMSQLGPTSVWTLSKLSNDHVRSFFLLSLCGTSVASQSIFGSKIDSDVLWTFRLVALSIFGETGFSLSASGTGCCLRDWWKCFSFKDGSLVWTWTASTLDSHFLAFFFFFNPIDHLQANFLLCILSFAAHQPFNLPVAAGFKPSTIPLV